MTQNFAKKLAKYRPKSKNMCHSEHVDDGASTPGATPRLFGAGAGGATTATTSTPPAPPSYGQVTNSSKVHRPEGHLSSVPSKPVTFILLSAHLPSVRLLLRKCRVAARAVWTPAWAPRPRTFEHVNNGASTPEATPRLYSEGESA
jgi:hypothetical protein